MSVPANRMVPRGGGMAPDPNKIMGLPKPLFWAIIVGGAILAFYLVKKSGSSTSSNVGPPYSGDQDYPDELSGAGGGGFAGAGLPNIPGTNGNPNPATTAAPPPTPDNSGSTTTLPDVTPAVYSPPYTGVPIYIPAPVLGAGGAYSTGPQYVPSSGLSGVSVTSGGGSITGRGIQGGL